MRGYNLPYLDMTYATLMEDLDVDLLPVVHGDTFVGVVTTTEIIKLDEILDQTSGEP